MFSKVKNNFLLLKSFIEVIAIRVLKIGSIAHFLAWYNDRLYRGKASL